MKRAFLTLCATLAVAAIVAPSVQAADARNFNAGRIIDDSVFRNKDAMNPQQIQQFLNSKVPSCDTYGTQTSELGGGTRRQYVESRGDHVPIMCLKDYFENPDTRENNLGVGGVPSGGRSAAQLIWDTAQEYSINPQVLIVLLQKEQGLVTDTWPLTLQFKRATGYACPDSGAGCDTQYYGFYNQIQSAAWQFNRYAEQPNSFNHVAGQFNNIRWSTNAGCGTSSVYIENTATAGLYNYTPYRPNQAALNAQYGTGDGCSQYGNRNFWLYFNDWFGATTGARFASEFAGWSNYPSVKAGGSAEAYFFYRNTGSSVWNDVTAYDGGLPPVTLAATNPINRTSIFSSTWDSPNRPKINFSRVYESDGVTLTSNQHKVLPGQIVVFVFNFTVPADTAPGVYREFFQPVAEGAPDWQMGSVGFLDVTVQPADHAAQVQRVQGITGQQSITVERGSSAPVAADFRNTGTQPWYDDISVPGGQKPVHLAHTSPINRSSHFPGPGWGNPSRPALTFAAVYEADGRTLAGNQHVAYPGQVARFHYYYAIPGWYPSGTYREMIQPVVEGATDWNMGAVSYIDVNVYGSDQKAKFYRFSGYPTITRGTSATVSIDYQNIGTQVWHDSTVNPAGALNLANTAPINRSDSLMWDPGWTSRSRPQTGFTAVYEQDGSTLAGNQHLAYPGQIVRFSYKYSPPSGMIPGVYYENIQPVLEGTPNWDIGAGGYFQVTVQ